MTSEGFVRSDRWIGANEKKLFLLLFLIFLAGFSIRFAVMGYGVGGGGVWYYSYLPSIVLDGDLDFSNQLAETPDRAVQSHPLFYEKYSEPKKTPTGLTANETAIGTAILMFPFFLLGHLLTLLLNVFGAGLVTNGYSFPEQFLSLGASIAYATLGLFLSYKFASKFFSKTASLIALLAITFGFSTFHYVMIEPAVSHGITILTVALFLTTFYHYRNKNSVKKWLILGVLAGLMMLSRWQEGFFLIIPAIAWAKDFFTASSSRERYNLIGYGVLFLATIVAVFLPQMIVWKVLYGSLFTLPVGVPKIFGFSNPLLVPFLFGLQHSLLVTTPIILVSLFGIPALWKKERFFAFLLVTALLLHIYINASLIEFGGNAFGARRFIDHVFIFTLFLAGLIHSTRNKWYWPLLLTGIVALVAYNVTYWFEYSLNIIHRRDPTPPSLILGKASEIYPTLKKFLTFLP